MNIQQRFIRPFLVAVAACVVLAACLAQILSLLTDALHALLDPRLRDEVAQ